MCFKDFSKYDKRFVFFIDVLGFKKLVERTSNPNDIKQVIDTLKKQFYDQNKRHSLEYTITQVSDCIIISFKVDARFKMYPLLIIMSYIQANAFVQQELLFRGGGTYGDVIHNENYLFGKAYQRALKYESEKAEFPRIIIDKNSFTKLIRVEEKEMCLELLKDAGDFYYLDFINNELTSNDSHNDKVKFFNKCRKIIEKNLKQEENILRKYMWLKDCFNKTIEEFNNMEDSNLEIKSL